MENQILHNPAVLQMFANNTIQIGLGDVVVPGAIRLHAKDGATLAGRDAAGARPLDAQRAGFQPESGGLELVPQTIEQRLAFAIQRAARPGAHQ